MTHQIHALVQEAMQGKVVSLPKVVGHLYTAEEAQAEMKQRRDRPRVVS